jgi:hypothetical protein
MLAYYLNLIFIVQQADTFDHKIDLLLAVVGHRLATPVSIQSGFPETGYSLQRSIVLVTLAENWTVVASLRSEIGPRLRQFGNVAMQPCGIHRMVLRAKALG